MVVVNLNRFDLHVLFFVKSVVAEYRHIPFNLLLLHRKLHRFALHLLA